MFSLDLLLSVLILFLACLVALAALSTLVLGPAAALPAFRLQREGLLFLDALVKNDASSGFPGLAAYDARLSRVKANELAEPLPSVDARAFPFLQSLRLVDADGQATSLAAALAAGPASAAEGSCYSFHRLVRSSGGREALLEAVVCHA